MPSKTRKVRRPFVERTEAGETAEHDHCPVCSTLGVPGEVVRIPAPRSETVTPWDDGGYGCLRCGVKAPEYVWGILCSTLAEKDEDAT